MSNDATCTALVSARAVVRRGGRWPRPVDQEPADAGYGLRTR